MLVLEVIKGPVMCFLRFFRDFKEREFGRVLWVLKEEIF
jgi:hypothetical protein